MKARAVNNLIFRLKGAESVFGHIQYMNTDPYLCDTLEDVWKKAGEGVRVCRDLQVLIKEQYRKEVGKC